MASLPNVSVEIEDSLIVALKYAVSIIESYQLDIRNAQETIGVDLISKGFCQGKIYKDAEGDLLRLIEGR